MSAQRKLGGMPLAFMAALALTGLSATSLGSTEPPVEHAAMVQLASDGATGALSVEGKAPGAEPAVGSATALVGLPVVEPLGKVPVDAVSGPLQPDSGPAPAQPPGKTLVVYS